MSEFKVHETGTVLTVSGEHALRQRLYDMGITPGASITKIRVAPLGDPLELLLRGYHLSIRKSEAKAIFMDVEGRKCL